LAEDAQVMRYKGGFPGGKGRGFAFFYKIRWSRSARTSLPAHIAQNEGLRPKIFGINPQAAKASVYGSDFDFISRAVTANCG